MARSFYSRVQPARARSNQPKSDQVLPICLVLLQRRSTRENIRHGKTAYHVFSGNAVYRQECWWQAEPCSLLRRIGILVQHDRQALRLVGIEIFMQVYMESVCVRPHAHLEQDLRKSEQALWGTPKTGQ
jgi:hypothetical protein